MDKKQVEEILGINLDIMDSFDITQLIRKIRKDIKLDGYVKNLIIIFLENLELEKEKVEQNDSDEKSMFQKFVNTDFGLNEEDFADLNTLEEELGNLEIDEFGNIVSKTEQVDIDRKVR